MRDGGNKPGESLSRFRGMWLHSCERLVETAANLHRCQQHPFMAVSTEMTARHALETSISPGLSRQTLRSPASIVRQRIDANGDTFLNFDVRRYISGSGWRDVARPPPSIPNMRMKLNEQTLGWLCLEFHEPHQYLGSHSGPCQQKGHQTRVA